MTTDTRSFRIAAPAPLPIGTWVHHSDIRNDRYGVVYGHVAQEPGTVAFMIGGRGMVPVRGEYRIVWEDGDESLTPNTVVEAWRPTSRPLADAATIAAMRAHVAVAAAAREKAAADKAARHAAERAALVVAHPELLTAAARPTWGGGRLAAENIRRQLKRKWPTVKFGVTSDHNAVNVRWTDGPPNKAVETICYAHKLGDFDGMTDSYDYDTEAQWCRVFGGVQYVFCSREHTLDGLRRAWVASGEHRLASEVPDTGMDKMDHGDSMRHWLYEAFRAADLTVDSQSRPRVVPVSVE